MTEADLAARRAEIDSVDGRIVALLAQRAAIVRQVAELKQEAAAVRRPEREEQVIQRIRALALARDLDPGIAERVFRALIAAMTDMQADLLQARGATADISGAALEEQPICPATAVR